MEVVYLIPVSAAMDGVARLVSARMRCLSGKEADILPSWHADAINHKILPEHADILPSWHTDAINHKTLYSKIAAFIASFMFFTYISSSPSGTCSLLFCLPGIKHALKPIRAISARR